MKLLLALCFTLFCTAVFSQNYKSYRLDVTPKNPLYRYDLKDQIQIPLYDTLSNFKSLTLPFRKDGGIVYLPQDNMPCVVPPMATLGQMPNLWRVTDKKLLNLTTPNPAVPFSLDELLKNK